MGARGSWLGVILLAVMLSGWPVQLVTGEEKTPGPGHGTEANSGGADFMGSFSLTSRPEPIHIRSRGLEFLYDEKRIVFRRDVVATQGDETLKSDILTVTYEEIATQNGTVTQPTSAHATRRQQLKEIVAEGNVEIVSGDRRATGKKAVFDEATRTVVLSGNAVLQEGMNRVSGARVTIFLDEKRSVVDGGAQMEFVPQRQKRKR